MNLSRRVLFSCWLLSTSVSAQQAIVRDSPELSRRPDPLLLDLRSRLHGVVRPKMSATLRFLVPGTIAEVFVREGQAVKEGDALVRLDDRLARARLHVAEIAASRSGEIEHAATQLEFGRKQLARLETLYARNAVSELELEEQRALVQRASAFHATQMEARLLAEANRDFAGEQLRHMTLFAPFDGVVTELHEKLGASVDPNVSVVSLANLELLDVQMHTPVSLYGLMEVGKKVELNAGPPVDDVILAEVLSVSPIINSASGTFRCVLQIDNAAADFPAGFAVSLSRLAPGPRILGFE